MKGISIEIYLLENGNYFIHGMRRWPVVPRIGETIFVEVDGVVMDAIVDMVCWGSDEESRRRFEGGYYVKVNLMATILNEKRGRVDLADIKSNRLKKD